MVGEYVISDFVSIQKLEFAVRTLMNNVGILHSSCCSAEGAPVPTDQCPADSSRWSLLTLVVRHFLDQRRRRMSNSLMRATLL